jgi:hypothetical protein
LKFKTQAEGRKKHSELPFLGILTHWSVPESRQQ